MQQLNFATLERVFHAAPPSALLSHPTHGQVVVVATRDTLSADRLHEGKVLVARTTAGFHWCAAMRVLRGEPAWTTCRPWSPAMPSRDGALGEALRWLNAWSVATFRIASPLLSPTGIQI